MAINLTGREKTDVFLWGVVLLGAGVLFLAKGSKEKEAENISELAGRKAAGETLSLAEETRLQDYIDKETSK